LPPLKRRRIERSRLPPLVENTVAALAENATVRGFSQELDHGVPYCEVELTVAGHHKDCLMDTRGNVVEVAYEAHVVKDGKRSEIQVGPEGEPLNHEE
jgi:hypothetical protein